MIDIEATRSPFPFLRFSSAGREGGNIPAALKPSCENVIIQTKKAIDRKVNRFFY
ncbi:MAG: hypothetical protein IKW74_01905 [Thermoguttaceae bacterium]|nr:hypothetical protein [Thermoguttaceae bacterium]